MQSRHDSCSQIDQVGAHGPQLLEVHVVDTSIGLENCMHLRLKFAALPAGVNCFPALLRRGREPETNGGRSYMNCKTCPGMNWFVRGMSFEHGCRCLVNGLRLN